MPVAVFVAVLAANAIGMAAPADARSEALDVRRDLSYGPEPGQQLDAYLPDSAETDRPAVLLVHGGGWTRGDKSEYGLAARRFASERGWPAFAVNYRLDAAKRWPAQVRDVQAVTRWVIDHADQLGVDPERVGIVGGSSGGHLAAMMATLGTADLEEGFDDDEPEVRAVVTWSAPLDLRDLQALGDRTPEDCAGDEECLGLLIPNAVEDFVGCPLESCPQEYEQASPVARASSGTVPMMLVNSEDEVIDVAQARAMAKSLASAGVEHELVVISGGDHSLQYADEAWAPTTRFLANHFDSDETAGIGSEEPAGPDPVTVGLVVAAVVAVVAALALIVTVRLRTRGSTRDDD